MRLQASSTMLHLARADVYSNIVMQNFLNLALTIQVRTLWILFVDADMRVPCVCVYVCVQDTCYGVRSMFLNKLITLFVARKLPPPFSVIFFLTVHDPEEDVKTSVSIIVVDLRALAICMVTIGCNMCSLVVEETPCCAEGRILRVTVCEVVAHACASPGF